MLAPAKLAGCSTCVCEPSTKNAAGPRTGVDGLLSRGIAHLQVGNDHVDDTIALVGILTQTRWYTPEHLPHLAPSCDDINNLRTSSCNRSREDVPTNPARWLSRSSSYSKLDGATGCSDKLR